MLIVAHHDICLQYSGQLLMFHLLVLCFGLIALLIDMHT